jgi:ABC-type spermidine/putrescine transport system permease subunit I
MTLPIYQSINKINEDVQEAAKTLGASPLRVFYEITLPLSLPGISAGVILVFILSIGTFLAPPVLGGPDNLMVANYITQTFRELADWPLASAMSAVYLIFLFVTITVYNYKMDLEEIYGGDQDD